MTESRSISVVGSAIVIQKQTTRGGPGRGFSGGRSWRQRRPTRGEHRRGAGRCDGRRGRHLLVGEGDVGLTRWTGGGGRGSTFALLGVTPQNLEEGGNRLWQ